MLELKKITKIYETGSFKQTALNDITINFRKSEFVSILGPSGSGKTTLLNIIGGLDKYTSGDLIINELSTKKFNDSDWDTFRNHRVGFVFQSYNLISHQTILSNVELALTLSGVPKTERTKRAKKALEQVGLKDHVDKLPNQLSGGQMQRVAIARALVNDPEILLADEPTGALDTETSKEIMKLLKDVSKKKLVIMVTHNQELAEKYSTRIISIKDGKIINDTNAYDGKINTKQDKETIKTKTKKTSMSFKTALSLSFNNLLTKKGRTILTAFAGSIGIIGISLILSLSTGVNNYIARVQEDTLTSYPLSIESATADMSTMLTDLANQNKREKHQDKLIYSNDIMSSMVESMSSQIKTNNLTEFKKYLEENSDELDQYANDIKYTYNLDLQIYKKETDKITKLNPSTVFQSFGFNYQQETSPMNSNQYMENRMNVFNELSENKNLLKKTYDILAGKLPEHYNEVVLIADSYGEISDYALYSIGIKDQAELTKMTEKIMKGEKLEKTTQTSYTYDELLNTEFTLVLNTDYYQKQESIWVDKSSDESYMKKLLDKSLTLKVVGIIKPNEESSITTSGEVGYTKELTDYVIENINNSEIAKEQLKNSDKSVLTNTNFSNINTYEMTLASLGIVSLDTPKTINIYPKDFKSKEDIIKIIDKYNKEKENNKEKDLVITYTDYVGILMNSITTIVDVISYVLIAFVSISLIVSSIMIGVITYISVLERTKEIGILRAIGARKKDISRVFNAETFITGLISGVLGIIITIILNIPINIIIKNLSGINNVSSLPPLAAIILIAISVFLTVVAGLIPSSYASKKDPVVALRSE
ncbi:MAG: ABC transporter ATP-binding protein/permease [Bacilli bacterium]|nr:ABC transporter ATP-binding protein/permease [Bacilli bacterium]